MLHFTCDLCGQHLSATNDCRYVVKMEVFAAHDPAELTEDDLDDDHLEEVSQLLEELEELPDSEEPLVPSFVKLQYDLCPSCHKRFLSDPLSKEAAQKFHFSEN